MRNVRKNVTGAGESPVGTRWPPLTVTRSSVLVGGSDHAFRALIQDLLTLSYQLQALRSILARGLGVSEPQYRVFLAIAQLEGRQGVSVSRVASYLRVSGAFVTMETRKLLRRRYVEKHADPRDGRSVLMSITPAGRQAFARFAELSQRINNELFRAFRAQDFRTLGKLARMLVGNAERAEMLGQRVGAVPRERGGTRRMAEEA
jgi:DNA-binding MarR family transcriptional regulator